MILRETDKDFKKLGAIRADITKLRAEIKTVEGAPLALTDIQMRVRSMLDIQVKRAMPEHTVRGFFSIRHDGTQPALGELNWGLLVAVIGRDVVEQRLADAALAGMKASGLQHGLPAAERGDRIDALKDEIRAKEVAEIHEVLRLEEAGFDVLPCSNADVELMLEVWGEIGGPADEDLRGAEPAEKPFHMNDGAVLHRTPDANVPPGFHNGPK